MNTLDKINHLGFVYECSDLNYLPYSTEEVIEMAMKEAAKGYKFIWFRRSSEGKLGLKLEVLRELEKEGFWLYDKRGFYQLRWDEPEIETKRTKSN